MKTRETIAEYTKERDAMVMASLEEFMAWSARRGYKFANQNSAQIAQHRMRSSIKSLPLDVQLASDKWLRDHGYESWID